MKTSRATADSNPRRRGAAGRSAGAVPARPRRTVLAMAMAGVACHALLTGGRQAGAQSLPGGLNVAQGRASVSVAGSQMTVTNSANAVLQWQSFSIGAGNAVRFDQPNSASRVLNQVVSANPSKIFGSLSSNGEVWLVNPYGVLFGRDARVDVGSLVVSTLAINADDWRDRRLGLVAGGVPDSVPATVVNQGELRSTTGGRVLLLAGAGGVSNEGLIAAPDGQVVLAAGHSVDLVDVGARNVAVRVTAPQGEVRNLGSIAVGGGRVDLWAAMVNQDGLISADSIGGRGGDIVLRAGAGLQAAAGSVTSARGGSGGTVTADAGGSGTALLAGAIDVTGAAGQGGEVQLLGQHVGLLDGASVDASGAAGGGEVLVGGGRRGLDPALPNSQAVYLGPGAVIRADATAAGDGGSIVLWSDQATRAYGSLSARGGPDGGNGGSIETSGAWLDARPVSVRTDAPQGKAGTWLLDPNNIFIVDSNSSDINIGGNFPDFVSSDDNAFLTTNTLNSALSSGASVTVTTGTGGANSQAGDITMLGATINPVLGNGGSPTLTLNAARNILIGQNSTIAVTGGTLGIALNAAAGGTGTIQIDNSTLKSGGGNIVLGGTVTASGPNGTANFAGAVGYDGNGVGISITRSLIDAGSGSITARGASLATSGVAGLAQGVSVSLNSTLTAADITLQGFVDTNSDLDRAGVVVDTGASVVATNSISIQGTVLSQADSIKAFDGVRVASMVKVANSSPNNGSFLDIDGLATGAQASGVNGIDLRNTGTIDASGAATAVLTGNRNIQLNGQLTTSTGGATTVADSDTVSGNVFLNNSDVGGVTFAYDSVGGSPSNLRLDGNVVNGAIYIGLGGSASLTISADQFNPGYASVQVPGTVSLFANHVDLAAGTTISSGATGDAIVVAGRLGDAQGNTLHFVNNAGSSVFGLVAGGRWLIYANDPTDAANYSLGGLNYDATVYGTQYGNSFNAGASTTTGNLQLFSFAPTLIQQTGDLISKTYDATSTVDVTGSGQVGGLFNGDHLYGQFDTPNVGSGKAVTVFPASASPDIRDVQGKPVYGYAVASPFALAGDVTPAALTLSGVLAADKTYDGTTAATVSGGTLSGLVGGEALNLNLGAGQFATKDAGAGIAVTGTATVADGTGLASNYSLVSGSYSTSASILRKSVTVGGIGAADKTYDGTAAASASGGTLSGLVGSEVLGLTIAGAAFDTANAGVNKTVTGSASLADTATGLAANYTLSNAAFSTTASILPRTVTATGITAADKVYDGSTLATLSFGGTLSNLVGSETLTLVLGSGQFATKDAGTGKTVTGSAALADGSGLASNYLLGNAGFTTTASILRRSVTVSGVSAASKTYDGTPAATLTGGAVSNLVGSETLTLVLSGGSFASKDAGTAKAVTGTAALADGGNGGLAANYTLASSAVGATADVLPRAVTVSGISAASKTYDGTLTATVSGGTLANLVGTETLALTLGPAQFATKDAGSAKTVTGSAALADGGNGGLAANYALTNPTYSTSADILRRSVSVSGIGAASKTYDGTTTAVVSGGTLSGLVGSETLALVAAGAFDTANAGVGKTVSGSAALADGSGLASNYLLGNAGFTATASILPRGVTVSGVTAASKTYDGTLAATVSGGTLANLVGTETLALTLGPAQFATKDAGSAKTVTGSVALADGGNGGLAANYALINPTYSTSADILRRPVSVSGIGAAGKTYDGTTTAVVSGGTLSGLVGSETLALVAAGAFDTANAGVGKTVSGSAALADGSGLASNYVLTGGGAFTTTADIDRRPLTLGGVLAANKTYDGTTQVSLSGGALTGLVGSETLGLTLSGAFTDRNAGPGKAVTGSATLADGSGGGLAANYQIAAGFATTADIAPRGLAVAAATMADKTYDGTTAATVTGWTLGGVIGADQVSVAAGSGAFSSAAVGPARAGTATASVLGGADAANYTLAAPAVATLAAINPATLVYVANPAVGRVGNVPASLSGSVTGFVAGETQAGATLGNLLFTTPANAASPVGVYAIDGSGLTAADYVFVQAPGNATALTLVLGAVTAPTSVAAEPVKPEHIQTAAVTPQPVGADRYASRTVDALQAVSVDPAGGTSFGALDLDRLTQDAVAALLEARNRYKRSLFDAAIRRLEEDPGLADAPPCATAAESQTGQCLVTDEVLTDLQGPPPAAAATAPAPPSAPGASPEAAPPVAVPAAPVVAPPPAVAAPAPAPAAPAAAEPAAVPEAPATTPAPAAAVATVDKLIIQDSVRPPAAPTLRPPAMPAPPRTVRTASLPQIQRKLAVLIGEDNYADSRIPQLDNAGRDAQAVAAVLESKLGYETLVVRDASREAIIGTLNKLAIEARPADSVLIYYAGHGELVEKTGIGYWIPANADPERPQTWISNNDIDKLLGRIRASQVALVSDSCFSGSLVSGQPVLKSGERNVDPQTVLTERASVAMSSGGNEPVADGDRNGHSPFANALISNLGAVPTWRIGSQVFENVRSDVAKRLPQRPQYGTIRFGRHTVGADYLFESRQLAGSAP